MLENAYKSYLVVEIKKRLRGAEVIIIDTAFYQGYPDLLILWGDRWGMLEVKKSSRAPYQPNQEHYLAKFGRMSFTATIFPENEDEVLNDLQYALEPRRNSRVPQSQQPELVELRRGKTR